MSDDPLVLATIGLVVATFLLVVATAVPVVQRYAENRARAAAEAARVIPVLNLLRPRLTSRVRMTLGITDPKLAELDRLITEGEADIYHSGELRAMAYDIGLKFANEVYLVHHFITSALDDLRLLAREAETKEGGKSIHDVVKLVTPHHSRGTMSTEARMGKVCAHYQAAETSLIAAESLIPEASRTVDGASFWDRYRTTLAQRSTDAEKMLVELRAQRR